MTTISGHTTRATGTILTASIYNTDHQNHITNANALNSGKVEGAGTVADGDIPVFDGTTGNAITTSGTAIADLQAVNANLTAIAALSTTAYGRSLLEAANASALRTLAGLVLGTDVQAFAAGLADIAALAITKGNLIVGDGTDWVALGIGSNGQIPIADSGEASGIRWGGAAVGIVEAGALSAQATLDIALGSADMYEIDLINVRPVNDGAVPNLRFSQSSTFLSGVSDYRWGLTDDAFVSDDADSEIQIGNDTGNAAGEGLTTTIRIFRPSAASFSKTLSHFGHCYDASSGLVKSQVGGGTLLANTNAIDGVRLFFSSGNISSGFYAVRSYSFS